MNLSNLNQDICIIIYYASKASSEKHVAQSDHGVSLAFTGCSKSHSKTATK